MAQPGGSYGRGLLLPGSVVAGSPLTAGGRLVVTRAKRVTDDRPHATTTTHPLIDSTTAEGSLLLTTYLIIYNYILADHHDVRHVLLS